MLFREKKLKVEL